MITVRHTNGIEARRTAAKQAGTTQIYIRTVFVVRNEADEDTGLRDFIFKTDMSIGVR